MCPEDNEKQRVFFALWPQPEALERLDGLADEMLALAGGRRTKRENLHLTLAFIGDVDQKQVDRLLEIGDELWPTGPDLPPLMIDRIDWWRHNRIIWCGGEVSATWQAAVASLRAQLAESGFQTDTRPFVPHVTLLRKVPRKPQLPELPELDDFVWPALDIRLVVSRSVADGVRYDPICAWRRRT